MKYILVDNVNAQGRPQLARDENQHWLRARRALMEAMANAGVLKTSAGLPLASTAAIMRIEICWEPTA